MSSFLAYTVNGLVLGSTYALTAIGYSMVYGILELVNFTHSTTECVNLAEKQGLRIFSLTAILFPAQAGQISVR